MSFLTATLEIHLEAEYPQQKPGISSYLIYNPCDGWWLVQAAFDEEGNFEYFYNSSAEGPQIWEPNGREYAFWCELPVVR